MWADMQEGIDLVRYGVLWQKVEGYEKQFDEMSKKMDKMEDQLTQLVDLANKGRGGFWVGMMIVSAVSSVIGYVTHLFGGGH